MNGIVSELPTLHRETTEALPVHSAFQIRMSLLLQRFGAEQVGS